MYGYYHPLYARHLMHEPAAEREALRQLITPTPAASETPRPLGASARWLAGIVTLVVSITALGVLAAQDPPASDQSSKTTSSCTTGGHKVNTFAPCPPAR
jgi:hypothetical protein